MDSGDGSQLGSIPTRPMRVKVLYSFDAENQTNCLARFPKTLDVPAVAIDDQSQVGIIELRQCIEAIISASPEILSRLDNADFTIYAYDYSEYDTPLVGQGRLSSLLANAESESTLASSDKPMITGRVCKNLPALFSNGVKETLEVKLRLTPVSKPSIKEFTRVASGSYGSSPATSAGFDPNAWNASLQQQANDFFSFDSLPAGGESTAAMLESMFGIGSAQDFGVSPHEPTGAGIPETPTNDTFQLNPALSGQSHSAPGSRSGSPIISNDSGLQHGLLRHQSFSSKPSNLPDISRPISRASTHSEVTAPQHARQSSMQSEPQQSTIRSQYEEYYNEDGQSRKRAKVTQTDWRGKSSFGARSSDLRVTAAKTSSMHMLRPVGNKSFGPGNSLEPPPRVPTPVPQRTRMVNTALPHPMNPRSMLRQASTADSDFMSDMEAMSDAIMSSPEEGSSPGDSITAEGTPLDIPSSPPLIPRYNMPPQPSSPGLPALPKPRMADSGYMSEPGIYPGDVVTSFEGSNHRSPDTDGNANALHSQGRVQGPFVKVERSLTNSASPQPMDVPPVPPVPISMDNIQMESPADMNRLPQQVLLNLPPHRRRGTSGAESFNSAPGTKPAVPTDTSMSQIRPTPSEPSHSRRGSIALPSHSASTEPYSYPRQARSGSEAPEKAKRGPLQRSRTSATDSEYGSPAPSDTEGRPKGPARAGSTAPRREAIERKLQEALAQGKMPEFCTHCGAIDTPTWRKLYVKFVDGKPGPLDYVEGEGEVVGVHTLETNEETGEVTKFAIRKTMKKRADVQPGTGFKAAVVCNPCGLWFNKTREMRPERHWTKRIRRRKRQQPGDDIMTDSIEYGSEAFFTDQIGPEDAADNVPAAVASQTESQDITTQPNLKRMRSNSMIAQNVRHKSDGDLPDARHTRAFTRAVQSSPPRFHGSQETPIELDMTPGPARRLLFPSPRREGEMKTLENSDIPRQKSASPTAVTNVKRRSPASKMDIIPHQDDLNIFEAFSFNKENITPIIEADEFSFLFEGSPSAVFKTPQRKTPGKKGIASANLRTPTRSSQRRRVISPTDAAANNNMNGNDFMTSPSSSRYFLRSTPSRLERTPTQRRLSGGNLAAQEMTPFSRHLAEMLSDSQNALAGPMTSPSRQFDFTDLPTFSTPGREMSWKDLDDMLSSEFAQGFTGSQESSKRTGSQ